MSPKTIIADAGLGMDDLTAIAKATVQGTLERKAAEAKKIINKKLGKATSTMNAATATPTPIISSTGAQSTGPPPTTAQPQTTTMQPLQTTATGGTTAQPLSTALAASSTPAATTAIPDTSTVIPPTTPPPTTTVQCAALTPSMCEDTNGDGLGDSCVNPMTGSAPPYCGCARLTRIFIDQSAYPTDMTYYTCLQRTNFLLLSNLFALTSLVGLESLTTVEVSLQFSQVSNLATIDSSAFPALTNVGNDIFIAGNNDLTIISGFRALTSVDSLGIASNPFLTNITGFSSLTTVTGTFAGVLIDNNPLLTDISGLLTLAQANGCTADQTTPLSIVVFPSPGNGSCNLDSYERVCNYIQLGAAAALCP